MDNEHIQKIRITALMQTREQQLSAALTHACNLAADIAVLKAENTLLENRLKATLAKLQADPPPAHANGEDKGAPCPAC